MKTLKTLLGLLKKKKASKPFTKHEINIKHHSGLYFQVGLIVSLFTMLYIVNTEFEVISYNQKQTFAPTEEPHFIGKVNVIKEPAKVEKPKKEKKAITKLPTEPKKPKPESNNKEDVKEPTDTESTKTTKEEKTGEPTTETPVDPENNTPTNVLVVEKVPVFPGCEFLESNQEKVECMNEKMRKIIQRKFNPYLAGELGLKGNHLIRVTFIINKEGKIDNLHIVTPKKALEQETKRVIDYMPQMRPGIQNGKSVNVMYNLPIVIKAE